MNVAVALVGMVVLSGCSEVAPKAEFHQAQVVAPALPPEMIPDPEPKSEPKPKTQGDYCVELIQHGAAIALAECVDLPPIAPGSFKKIKSPQIETERCLGEESALIGYTNQGPKQKSKVTGMPPAQATAVKAVAEHPVTTELLGYAEGGMHYYANFKDNTWQGANLDMPKQQEAARLSDITLICMEVGGDEAYGTQAGIRMVATHEGAHAAHYEVIDIARGKGPKAQAAKTELQNLQEICRQEYSLITERFRMSHEAEATKLLQKIRAELVGRGEWSYVAASDALMQRFKTVDGLHDLVELNQERFDARIGSLYFLIDKLRYGEVREKTIYDLKLESDTDWSVFDFEFNDFVSEQLSYMREGDVFGKATSDGAGHPTNVTEQVASGLTTTQIHPKGVAAATNKLTLPHRRIAARKFASIQRLMEMLNPKLAAQMNLGKVAESTPVYEHERKIAQEIREQIANTSGDWRQLPASRARTESEV